MRKAIIYVETIAGVGHMPVAAYLAKALIRQNIDVYIMASAHSQDQAKLFDFGEASWCVLPTFLKDPATGKAQYTSNGKPYAQDLEFQAERSAIIQSYLQKMKPNYLITETWPLGKGHFDAEMIPVFESCKETLEDCRIFCIGRDVMNYPNHRGAGIDSDKVGIDILNKYYVRLYRNLSLRLELIYYLMVKQIKNTKWVKHIILFAFYSSFGFNYHMLRIAQTFAAPLAPASAAAAAACAAA